MKELAKHGDLLFYKVTPQSNLWARLIAIAQFWRKEGTQTTQYSHVSIVMHSKALQIEAHWPKVRITEIDWDSDRLELCEISGITDDERWGLVAAALEHVGEWYDIGQLFFGIFDFKKAEICTSLVRSAAATVGYKLGGDFGKLLTPNELREDKQIRRKR